MAELLNINMVTPEKLFFSGEAEMIVIPGTEGMFGAMREHAPTISMIGAGVIELHGTSEGDQNFFIAGGYAEVSGENCTVLAEELVNVVDLSAEALQKDIEQLKFDAEHAESDKEKSRIKAASDIAKAKLDAVA